jgi:ATP-dependent helicase/nuclease subunit A
MTRQDKHSAVLDMLYTGSFTPAKGFYKKNTAKAHKELIGWFDGETERLTQLCNLYSLHVRADTTAALLYLAETVTAHFEAAKRTANAYDFDDLIARTGALLGGLHRTQWVLYKLDRGLSHILVDEAQDTSPAQWTIIKALADEFFAGIGIAHRGPRTLFVVGDQKQSIYSFQGADAQEFEAARAALMAKAAAVKQGQPHVSLLTSYRSVPQILEFVDAVFPTQDYVHMGVRGGDENMRKHYSSRGEESGFVEVWPLIESEEPEKPDPWTAPVDHEGDNAHRQRIARKIAVTVKSWIGRRYVPSAKRALRAGDVLILLQKRGVLFSAIISELRQAGVPVAGADRLTLNDSIAVQDLLALAQAMVSPEDDYSLACVLKSPFVPEPFSDDDLFALAHGRGETSLFHALRNCAAAKAKANADYLQQLGNLAARGPHAFFTAVLAQRRKAMTARLGPESRDASDALIDITIDYEFSHDASLAGFIVWFQASPTEIKREMEGAVDQVRLMTVHGAKGLEAPVVIIPDAAEKKNDDKTNLVNAPNGCPVFMPKNLPVNAALDEWKNQARSKLLEEHKRLLYVAMTRAKDELYIAGSLTRLKKKSGEEALADTSWYAFISKQIAGLPMVDAGDGVKRYGMAGRELDARQKPDEPEADKLPPWIGRVLPLEPARAAVLVTSLSRGGDRVLHVSDAITRGSAMHAFLMHLPENAMLRDAYAAASTARFGVASDAAAKLVARVKDPDVQLFFGVGSHSEVEIQARLDDGRPVTGRIDRVRITDSHVYLVDYKSDANPPGQLEAGMTPVKQLALYWRCLRDMHPEHECVAALFWTSTLRLDVVPPALLSQACDLADG